MFKLRSPWLLPAAWLLAATAAQAGHQAPALPQRHANPLDAQAAVPPVRHDSAFRHYRGHADEKLAPWKDANDAVGRIGGWRSYAREAAQSGAQTEAPPAPSGAAPKPAGRGGHQHH
jgi:hypothetical protein